MATPTPQPPLTPNQRLALEQRARYQKIMRNLAIGGVIVSPIVILLPPRKLDLYTFALATGFYLSADYLCELNTGRGLIQQLTPRNVIDALPTDKARETQRMIREEREKGRKALEKDGALSGETESKGPLSALEKIWMGDEKEGWKERRLEEERKALEEGKGYTDLILEQIWDVWNWDQKGKKNDEEKKE